MWEGKFRACRSLYLNTFVQLSDAPFMRVYLASRSVLTEGRQAGKPQGQRQQAVGQAGFMAVISRSRVQCFYRLLN